MTFGDWLRGQREARGWSQTYLAKQIGVTPQAINQLEQGKNKRPSTEAAIAMARVFEVGIDDVFVAAGLAGAPPPDALAALLAEARLLGYPPHKLKAIEQGVVDFPAGERAALIAELEAELGEMRRQRAAQTRHPQVGNPHAPQEPGANHVQAGGQGGVAYYAAEEWSARGGRNPDPAAARVDGGRLGPGIVSLCGE